MNVGAFVRTAGASGPVRRILRQDCGRSVLTDASPLRADRLAFLGCDAPGHLPWRRVVQDSKCWPFSAATHLCAFWTGVREGLTDARTGEDR